ncbi:Shieldin complex subunit 2 [Actinomortierella ambigua]|nr:Shieldin complex subunit 2 [Actinomortierella ambigua]
MSIDYGDRVPCTLEMLSVVPATLPEDLEVDQGSIGKEEEEEEGQEGKQVHEHESDIQIGGNISLIWMDNGSSSSSAAASSCRKHALPDIDEDVDPIGSFTEHDPGVDLIGGTDSPWHHEEAGSSTAESTPTSSQTLLRTPSKRFIIPPYALYSPSSRHQSETTTSSTTATPNKRMRSASDISKRFIVPTTPTRSPNKRLSNPSTPSSRLRPASAVGLALHASTSSSSARAPATLAGHSRERSAIDPPRPILGNLLEIAREERASRLKEVEESDALLLSHHHSPIIDDVDQVSATRSAKSARWSTIHRPTQSAEFLAFREQEQELLAESDLSQSSMVSAVMAADPSKAYITQEVTSNTPLAAKDGERSDDPSESWAGPETQDNDKDMDQVSQKWRLCSFESLASTQIMSHEAPEGSLPPTQLMVHELPFLEPTQTVVKEEKVGEEAKVTEPREPDEETGLESPLLQPASPLARRRVHDEPENDRLNDDKKESINLGSTQLRQPSLPPTDFLNKFTLPIPASVLKYADRLTPLAHCRETQVLPQSKHRRWHLLVLVTHVDPVERVETKKGPQAGQQLTKAAMTVCDGSAAGFKIVLWREKTLWLEEIQEGDVVLLSEISLSEHLQKIGGNTTNASSVCRLDGCHKEIEEKLRVLATKRRQLGLQVLQDIGEPSFYASMMPLSLAATVCNDSRSHDASDPEEGTNGGNLSHARDERGSTAGCAPPILALADKAGPQKSNVQSTLQDSRLSSTAFVPLQQPSPAPRHINLVPSTAQSNKTFLQAHSRAAVGKSVRASSSSSLSSAAGSKLRGQVVYTMLQKPNQPSCGWYIGVLVVKENRFLRVETEQQPWIDEIRLGAVFEFYGRYTKTMGSKEVALQDDEVNGAEWPKEMASVGSPIQPTTFPSIQALRAARFSGDAVVDVYLHTIDFSIKPARSWWLDNGGEGKVEEGDGFIQCICIQCQTPAASDPANPTLFFCRQCRDMEAATAHRRPGTSGGGGKGCSFSGLDSSLQWSYPPFHVVIADHPRRLGSASKKHKPQREHQEQQGDHGPLSTETGTLRVFCSYGRGDELFVSIPARRWIHERQQREQQDQRHPWKQRHGDGVYDRWKRLLRLLTAPSPPPAPSSKQHRGKEVSGEKEGDSKHGKIRFHVRVLHTSSSSSAHVSPQAPEPFSADSLLDNQSFDKAAMTVVASSKGGGGPHRRKCPPMVAAKATRIQPFYF